MIQVLLSYKGEKCIGVISDIFGSFLLVSISDYFQKTRRQS